MKQNQVVLVTDVYTCRDLLASSTLSVNNAKGRGSRNPCSNKVLVACIMVSQEQQVNRGSEGERVRGKERKRERVDLNNGLRQ